MAKAVVWGKVALRLDHAWSVLRQHLVPVIILTLLVLVAYPEWLSSGYYGVDDLSHLNIPQRMFAAYAWRNGEIPLWNPFNFGGQPFLAAGQAGPLYFPNIAYVFLPVETATKLLYLLHELFAAYSMYILVFHLGKRRAGALVAAISFATCGFLVGHQIHTQMFDAFCWFPIIVYLFLNLLKSPSWSKTAGFAFCLAGEIYAGHPQITFYVCIFICFYTLLYFFHEKFTSIRRQLLHITAGVLLGLTLSAASWVPTLNLIRYSNRDNASGQFLLGGSMPPQGLIQWLDPYLAGGGVSLNPFSPLSYEYLYGSPLFWEFLCYTGIIALAAALTGSITIWKTSVEVRIFTIIGVLATLLSLGSNTFLAYFLIHMPGFDLFRIPARYIGISDFTIAVLCGFGINHLTHQIKQRTLFLFLGILGCFTCLILFVPAILRVPGRDISLYLWPALILAIITLIAFRNKSTHRNWLTSLIPALAILDSVAAASSISSFPLVRTAAYLQPTQAEIYLLHHLPVGDPFIRVLAMPDTSLSHDASSAYDIPTIDGYDSLVPKWYVDQVNLTWDTRTLKTQTYDVLDEMAVKYIVTKTGDTPYSIESLPLVQNWESVFVGKQETVWENPSPVDAAWLANIDGTTMPDADGTIQLKSWKLNQSTWSIDTNKEAMAIISQMYDPGWAASLDGKNVTVQQINKILTGIRIEKPGKHVLVLRYQPGYFWFSLWISCGTFVLLVLILFGRRRPI